jgi:hypothetical protein
VYKGARIVKPKVWYHTLIILIFGSATLLLWSASSTPAQHASAAEPQQYPEPAPERPEPGLPGGGGGGGGGGGRDAPTPIPAGRITGTVVDQVTGAPVAGLPVQVGDQIVISDIHGNYERVHMLEGTYEVRLLIDPSTGELLQAPIVVQLEDGENVVQHLYFASPLLEPTTEPTMPPATATAAPAEAEPTATPTPAAAPPQGAGSLPGSLPVTGHEPAPVAPAVAPAMPNQLPATANNSTSGVPWGWVILAVLLLMAGLNLWLREQPPASH